MTAVDQESIDVVRSEIRNESSDPLNYTDAELAAFLKVQKNVDGAAKAAIASAKWKKENPVSIVDVAPFYRSPPGCKFPAGCTVLLEDMKGDVARDSAGRPIAVMIGMNYGSELEQMKQVAYVMQRASLYCHPNTPGEVCYIVEFASRETKKMNSSFRLPDATFRSFMDLAKICFPGMQFSITHFCGLPSYVVAFFNVTSTFMSKDFVERMRVASSFKHLIKEDHIDLENCLSTWHPDGKLTFDIDEYVEWRATEERMSIPGRGEGRNYEVASSDRPFTTHDLLGTPEGLEVVIKHGSAEKRGSGVGLFASVRWKKKKLVLVDGSLVYFNSWKISKSVHPDRIIDIDSSCTVKLGDPVDQKETLILTTGTREFVFGFYTIGDAESWLEVLSRQCEPRMSD